MTEPFSPALLNTLERLASLLRQRGWMLTTAESCTGGLIAAACTELAGASDWFERGFVSYSNAAKTELLGVPSALIERHGAVSEPVARAMAEGALRQSQATLSLAVTGVAGPSGGSAEKPVGTVWFAWCLPPTDETKGPHTLSQVQHFVGTRRAVRAHTLTHALNRLEQLVANAPRT